MRQSRSRSHIPIVFLGSRGVWRAHRRRGDNRKQREAMRIWFQKGRKGSSLCLWSGGMRLQKYKPLPKRSCHSRRVKHTKAQWSLSPEKSLLYLNQIIAAIKPWQPGTHLSQIREKEKTLLNRSQRFTPPRETPNECQLDSDSVCGNLLDWSLTRNIAIGKNIPARIIRLDSSGLKEASQTLVQRNVASLVSWLTCLSEWIQMYLHFLLFNVFQPSSELARRISEEGGVKKI